MAVGSQALHMELPKTPEEAPQSPQFVVFFTFQTKMPKIQTWKIPLRLWGKNPPRLSAAADFITPVISHQSRKVWSRSHHLHSHQDNPRPGPGLTHVLGGSFLSKNEQGVTTHKVHLTNAVYCTRNKCTAADESLKQSFFSLQPLLSSFYWSFSPWELC